MNARVKRNDACPLHIHCRIIDSMDEIGASHIDVCNPIRSRCDIPRSCLFNTSMVAFAAVLDRADSTRECSQTDEVAVTMTIQDAY
jgi:hypothetical protein